MEKHKKIIVPMVALLLCFVSGNISYAQADGTQSAVDTSKTIQCPIFSEIFNAAKNSNESESKVSQKENRDESKLSTTSIRSKQTLMIQTGRHSSGGGGGTSSKSSSVGARSSVSDPALDLNKPPAPTRNFVGKNLYYVADFETGDLSQWWRSQSAPNAVTVVENPVRSGRYAAKFSVSDNDTHANYSSVPNADPRAQLVPDFPFYENDDVYISLSTFYPSNFPRIDDWLVIFGIHGEPYNGPSTVNISVIGDQIQLNARENGAIWTSPPIRKGTAWEDLVLHVKFSPDASVGFVEIWHDGVLQRFKNGETRFYYATLRKGINWTGPGGQLEAGLTQYRSAAAKLGTVVLYHDNFRIGTTYEAVAIKPNE